MTIAPTTPRAAAPRRSPAAASATPDALLAALRHLLAERGIAMEADIADRVALTDRASPAQGARMVARAWVTPPTGR